MSLMSKVKTYDELKAELEAEIAWFESDMVKLEELEIHYKNALSLLEKIENKLNDTELAIKKLN